MDAILKPRTAEEICDVVKWAAAEEQPLEVIGSGSKRSLGRPVQAAHVLDLSDYSGVEVYEPAELVLTVKAGTPIKEIEKLVDDNGQELSFEPMDYGPLLGQAKEEGTIGGLIGANVSGPRRIKAGAARDHILGLEAVSGRGEIFKSGGRVVKNVTGYDLPRGLCGAWGTLAVSSLITLKVNPKPETSATLVLEGLSDDDAISALCKAMRSSAEVSGAAHIPSQGHDAAKTLLRLEGFETSIAYRAQILSSLLADLGKVTRLNESETKATWDAIRNVDLFCGLSEPVWRISVAPTAGVQLSNELRNQIGAKVFFDWSGGLVWLMCPDGKVHDQEIRAAVHKAGGGHATLVRADAATRSSVDVFEPQPAPLAALSGRLKAQFDPNGILNPGRMTAGQ
ncbi:glycolate oxidase, subunit GlcE [Roseibium sp. TrichSKD4]|uniref:glycolate oxidase subunit GlcE n=1 Tax=Roseibium sp. TrichSKD4 TaxID=744980 RepID=UPI0001E56307|nr:glycolate oxidase subunit GlcE [Roseibium sp. TrichSKD4]EFO34558.1 glycolate oxidase, subunit GlcE [Roseibium sp. TrichSKD4]